MDFVEDITPHELRHAAIPNSTIDFWERTDLLALGELTSFVRHTASYGMTLTKMVKRCPGQGRDTLSKSYNRLIEHQFLIRIEFTYARPDGTGDRSGQRYTKHAVSRVPISEDNFARLVAQHAPGKKVIIPYGQADEQGQVERRRVKILASEVYCHLGAGKIAASGTRLDPHPNARGMAAQWSAAPEHADTDPGHPSDDGSPESGNPTSGVTTENATDPQVAPESGSPDSGQPDSITKDGPRTTDRETQSARALPSVGCVPSDPTGAARIDDAADTDRADPEPSPAQEGKLQTARAETGEGETHTDTSDDDTDTLTREQARATIQHTLNTKPRTTNTSHHRDHRSNSVGAEND